MTAQTIETPRAEEAPGIVTFDFAALSPRERYKLLIGAVVPRPIALVTTVDAQGKVNAAPFSFFNCLSADPAILALGVEYRPTGAQKDTGRNIRETLAFTVNIVSDALVAGMNVCAVPFEPGTDELAEAGLTAMPGAKVPCPWIGQAPAAFECRHHTTTSACMSTPPRSMPSAGWAATATRPRVTISTCRPCRSRPGAPTRMPPIAAADGLKARQDTALHATDA